MNYKALIPLFLLVGLLGFIGCSKPTDEHSIVGYWKVSPESIEALLREQAGDAAVSEEDFGKQLARHFLNKMVIEFTGTECNQYRGGRGGKPMPYSIVSIENDVVTVNITDKVELSITVAQDSLSFPMPGKDKDFTWLRMREEQVAQLQQAIDEIENGPAATAKPEQRFMWIMNAAPEKVEAYLEKYPDLIEARAENQQTLLHYAVRFENEELAKLALEKGADVNAEDDSKETAFYIAATESEINESLIHLLLEAGSDIDHKNDWGGGETAFQYAIRRENLENAKMLHKLGAAVDAGVEIGKKTPLFVAIEDEQTEIVKFLIENGANIHHTTFDSKDGALYMAARYGTLETIELLLEKGMNPNAGNAHDWKPINNVTFRDKEKIEAMRLLTAAGADINERGAGDSTLLSGAIRSQDIVFAKALIEAGADFEMITSFEKTHYDKAKEAGLTELVAFMDQKRSERIE